MEKFVLFIKTYHRDFARVQNLLRSIEQYNQDNIPVCIAVNNPDYKYFKNNLSGKFTLIRDSDIIVSKMKDGWRYSAIIKPHLYRLKMYEKLFMRRF